MAGQIFPDMGSISSAGAKNGDIEQGANSGKAERKVRRSSLRKPGEVEKTAQLFVPPHLRVVQIQENPMVLGPEESIFDNLVYGIKQRHLLQYCANRVAWPWRRVAPRAPRRFQNPPRQQPHRPQQPLPLAPTSLARPPQLLGFAGATAVLIVV